MWATINKAVLPLPEGPELLSHVKLVVCYIICGEEGEKTADFVIFRPGFASDGSFMVLVCFDVVPNCVIDSSR